MGQVDLQGKTLMPSFIDAHGHIAMLAQYTTFVNLGKCTDFQQATETIKEGKTLYQKEEQ